MMLKPSTIELNPQQAKLWKDALNQPLTILDANLIQDAIWMQQFLLSALGHGEKSLILNFSLPSINALQTILQKQNLEKYCSTFLDKQSLENIDYEKNELKKSKKAASDLQFEAHYKQLLRNQSRLRKKYEAGHNPVFANLSWSEVLGLFLAKQNESDKASPNITRVQEGFNFTQEEFTTLFKLLANAQQLYQPILRLDHPLRHLHPHIFLKKKEYNALNFCQHKLKIFQQRFEILIQKYQQSIDHYSRLLRKHLEQKTEAFLQKIDHLLDQIEDKTKLYGARFLDAKLGKIKWYAPISNQGKSALNDYKYLIKAYGEIKKDFERIRWFSFSWPPEENLKTIAPVKVALQSFEHVLKQGHGALGQFLQEEEVRLNAKAALPELQQSEQIAKLEEEMEELLSELNKTELLSAIVENKMLTLGKRRQYLLQVQQQFEQLEQHLADFPAFYDWQRFWLQRTDLQQTLIKNLIESKSKDWPGIFQFWYWQQILLLKKNIDLPAAHLPLGEYYEFWQKHQAQLPAQIEAQWQAKRIAAQQYFKKWKRNGQVENWQETELKELSNFFPILIGESSVKDLIPTNFYEALFDWVLVFEAAEEELDWYQSLGKRVLVFNSKPPVEEDESELTVLYSFSKAQANAGFWDSFEHTIRPYFGAQRLQRAWQIEGLQVPLVLKSAQTNGGGFVFLQDGFLSTEEVTDFAWEYLQQQKLHTQQWEIIPVWSSACWQNLNEECRRIAAQIISKEKKITSASLSDRNPDS